MELKDTVELMLGKDYKNRFKAEYHQLKIRFEKLKNVVNHYDAAVMTGKEPPKYDCPIPLLKDQLRAMAEYLHILEVRAMIEQVRLKTPTLDGEQGKKNEGNTNE